MSWLQLEFETYQSEAEPLSALLEQLAAVSVTLSASSGDPVFDAEGETKKLWHKTKLSALFDQGVDLDLILSCLRNHVGAENIFSHKIELLEDKDWISEFKAAHRPLIFANRVCIVPSWCTAPQGDLLILSLDPGLAFGTGTHPTTTLCIEWLAKSDLTNKTVIDYGCGSGILAMAAARLGAKQVYAVDIDAKAVQATKENTEKNGLSDKITAMLVEEMSLPVADVVVANILMNPLKELAENFAAITKSGGEIMLSGLLRTQAEECAMVYAKHFSMSVPVYNQTWSGLHGIKS